MGRVVVVTSGKGGVGKTTTSASFAAGLASRGKKTVVIDFDIGLRNLDLILGLERRIVFDFVNVIRGEARLGQALVRDKNLENLWVLAASQTRDKDALDEEGVARVIDELHAAGYDYIVCDSPAGIETGALMALRFADDALIVTNPEVSAVRDADRMIGIVEARSKRAEEGRESVSQRLIVTRYVTDRARKGDMLSHDDVRELLNIPLIGVVPESPQVLECSNQGVPVILRDDSPAGAAYRDIVARYLGEDVPLRIPEAKATSIWSRLFGG